MPHVGKREDSKVENKMERRYGLFTAICMVVGIIIGSGVFFKAQTILQKTQGDLMLGIIAWIIGGGIMLACVLAFAVMAQKYERVNGIVDYAEATVGPRYAYYIGWFLTTIYYPTLVSVLSWLSARYTLVFVTSVNPDFPLLIPADQGGCVMGPECIALMLFYMCASFALNVLSPKLAGKFQVSTTIIKLIPLGLMVVVGVIYGLMTGGLANNFAYTLQTVEGEVSRSGVLFAAVCATSFAYEGWIIATSINSELKDARRNLPRALVIGSIIVVAVYISYFLGVAGGASTQELIDQGATVAFTNVFGNVFGNILNLFIAVSCIGTMNGLMLGCVRGTYALAARGHGPRPDLFSQIDSASNMPANSSVLGLLFCAAWGLYFYLANLACTWTGPFAFDSSEIPVVTIYGMYIPIFALWMKKATDETVVRRFVLPALAIVGSAFMILACFVGHGIANLWYLIVFAVVMLIGGLLDRRNNKK